MESVYEYVPAHGPWKYRAMDLRPCLKLDHADNTDAVAELRRKWRALALVIGKAPDTTESASQVQWMLGAYDAGDEKWTEIQGCVLGWCPEKESAVMVHAVWLATTEVDECRSGDLVRLMAAFIRALSARETEALQPLQTVVLPVEALPRLADVHLLGDLPHHVHGFHYQRHTMEWTWHVATYRKILGLGTEKKRSGSGYGGNRQFAYSARVREHLPPVDDDRHSSPTDSKTSAPGLPIGSGCRLRPSDGSGPW